MKYWSKVAVSLLSASLLTTAQPIFAEGNPTEQLKAVNSNQTSFPKEIQAALDKVFEQFPVMKQLKIYSQNYQPSNEHKSASWYIYLDDMPDNPVKGTKAHLELDGETGVLRSMQLQVPNWATPDLPNGDKASTQAQQFLEMTLGKETANQYQVSQISMGSSGITDNKGNSLSWKYAVVQFERLVNGVPFNGDAIQVEVDAQGHIINYQRKTMGNVELEKFPSPNKTLPSQAIYKIYNDKMKMKLTYNEHQGVLKYVPNRIWQFDANTGEDVSTLYSVNIPKEQRVSLNSQGKKLIIKSEEDLRKILKKQFSFDTAGLVFEQQNQENTTYSGIDCINYELHQDFNQESTTNNPSRHAFVSVDKKTGQLLNINIDIQQGPTSDKKITQEDAIIKSLDLINQYAPSNVKAVDMTVQSAELNPTPSWVDVNKLPEDLKKGLTQSKEYIIYFNELNNGIPVEDRNYYVIIDEETGQLKRFSIQPQETEVSLPEAKPVITASQAKDIYLKKYPPVLHYILETYMGQQAPTPKLIYQFQNGNEINYLNAVTGKVVETTEQ